MKQISLLGMIFLPGTFLAVSNPQPSSRLMTDPTPDFLFDDLLQLDTGWQCSKDLAVACSLCRAHFASDIRDRILVQKLVGNEMGRRKEKRSGRPGQDKSIFETKLADVSIFR